MRKTERARERGREIERERKREKERQRETERARKRKIVQKTQDIRHERKHWDTWAKAMGRPKSTTHT